MAGYSSDNAFWPNQQTDYNYNPGNDFYHPQNLEVKTYMDQSEVFDQLMQNSFYDASQAQESYSDLYGSKIIEPADDHGSDFYEPPLLEELEIYPDRILEKTLAVLNPFHKNVLADNADFILKDADIAGPITFCLLYALFLFLSGNKAHFGYVYGLSVMAVIFTYILFSLMSINDGFFTLTGVASVLGYSMIPIVCLSLLGVFISLHGDVGMILASGAVLWAAVSASKLYITITGDTEQRLLIAYPCAIVYGVFALVVIF